MAGKTCAPRGLSTIYFQILISMCIWLLTACLGVVGPRPQYVPIVSGGAPPPIIPPTTTFAPAPFPTFAPAPSTAAPTTAAPTTAAPTTAAPTTAAPTTAAPTTAAPTTAAPTTAAPTTAATTPRPTTLAPLTPVPTGITAPPGVTPTQQPLPIIDPRLQTTAPLRMTDAETLVRFGGGDYQDVVIEADEGEISFPREKRSLDDVEIFATFDTTENSSSIFSREKRQTTTCACMAPAACPGGNTDGTGLIDFRIVAGQNGQENCAAGQRYCCGIQLPIAQVSCGSRLQSPTVYPTQAGQSRYGDYPWMVVILTTDNQYVGGGTLIDTQHVITTAHRISPYPNGSGIKIRAGEWDAAGNYEQYPYRDFSIARVWVHETFNPNTLQNDLALIRLTGGIPSGTPAVVPVCLPTAGQNFDGRRCWVSGWGKDAFGTAGRYQTILKTVDVPIIASAACETTLRTTRLGTAYSLDRAAFICAGGEANKDACTGDGGSGLVCELTTGRWTVAGLVAWGLGCATQGVPAAYVNIVNYLPWINSRVATA